MFLSNKIKASRRTKTLEIQYQESFDFLRERNDPPSMVDRETVNKIPALEEGDITKGKVRNVGRLSVLATCLNPS